MFERVEKMRPVGALICLLFYCLFVPVRYIISTPPSSLDFNLRLHVASLAHNFYGWRSPFSASPHLTPQDSLVNLAYTPLSHPIINDTIARLRSRSSRRGGAYQSSLVWRSAPPSAPQRPSLPSVFFRSIR